MNTKTLLFKLVALDFMVGETITDDVTGQNLFVLSGELNSDGKDTLLVVHPLTGITKKVKFTDILNSDVVEDKDITYLDYILLFYDAIHARADIPLCYDKEFSFGERCYDGFCPKYAGRLHSIQQGYSTEIKATIQLNGSINFKHVIPLERVEFGIPSSDECKPKSPPNLQLTWEEAMESEALNHGLGVSPQVYDYAMDKINSIEVSTRHPSLWTVVGAHKDGIIATKGQATYSSSNGGLTWREVPAPNNKLVDKIKRLISKMI